MLIALNEGKRTLARDAIRSCEHLCPECGSRVILRRGRVVVPHFAHKPDASCSYGEGETVAHLMAKQQLFDRLSREHETLIEARLHDKGINRTADLLVRAHGYEAAIELQHSMLTEDTLLARKHDYESVGIYQTWIAVNGRPRLTRMLSQDEGVWSWDIESHMMTFIPPDGASFNIQPITGTLDTLTFLPAAPCRHVHVCAPVGPKYLDVFLYTERSSVMHAFKRVFNDAPAGTPLAAIPHMAAESDVFYPRLRAIILGSLGFAWPQAKDFARYVARQWSGE